MTLFGFERMTAPAAPAVSSAEIADGLRVADEMLAEAATMHVPAAEAHVGDYGGVALVNQTIRAIFGGPFRAATALRLPIGPVPAGAPCTVTVSEFGGAETTLDVGLWRLVSGRKPELRLLDATLPAALAEDQTMLLIDYTAGFGATTQSVPRDLKLAVLDQAIRLFDRRGDDFTRGATPLSAHAARIISRYRGVRL